MGQPDLMAAQVQALLEKRIEDGTLDLCTLPASIRHGDPTVKPNASPKEVLERLQMDHVLAVEVLRVANKPGGGGAVANLQAALNRLGVERTAKIINEVQGRALPRTAYPAIEAACRTLWEHAVAVAVLSRDVAALCGVQDVEGAYLTGLLHDIGKAAVAWVLLEAEASIVGSRTNVWMDGPSWVRVVDAAHRTVGLAMARRWNLPPSVSEVIQSGDDLDPGDRLSIGNAVRFANALAKNAGIYTTKPEQTNAQVLLMVGRSLLGLDESVVERLTIGLNARVRQAA